MAQVIAPEIWQDGIDDNQLLPNRYTVGLFTGRGVNLANDGRACRVYDIVVSDYITDYDDRRLNGLGYGESGFNADGRDGWGASSYGVFQDVRFTSKVYAMGRHRSTAMRLFDEMQYDASQYPNPSASPAANYADGIGKWGDASQSFISTNGQSLLKTAALMSKAKDRWEKQVLGPDMDKYVLFVIMNGHQVGRLVGKTINGVNYNDRVFDGDCAHYEWVAQPGTVQGQALPPQFAPIHCIEWDGEHVPQMLNNIKVTWNNLFIEQTDRVVLIDPFYEYALLSNLTGQGVPATDSAYTDLQNGSFTKLMGWDFNFEIPSTYWPYLYVDDNLNVVHSSDGAAAFDAVINSIDGKNASGEVDNMTLMRQLLASDRMSRTNWIRTEWVPASGDTAGYFTKVVSNYPLGMPAADGLYDIAAVSPLADVDWKGSTYPWDGQGAGYGLHPKTTGKSGTSYASGPVLASTPTRVKTIGMFLYKKAAQMSQEYSEMVTDEGRTRGKFQEMCMDVKYDAWVIENYSHGIIPIIDASENNAVYAIPVSVSTVTPVVETPAQIVGATISEASNTITAVASYNIAPAQAATLSYVWEYNNSGTWTTIAGQTNSTLSVGSSSAFKDKQVRCKITASGSATGVAISNDIKATYTA